MSIENETPSGETTETREPPSMDETIRAAVREHFPSDAGDIGGDEPLGGDEGEGQETAPADKAPRDSGGKFAKKDADKAPADTTGKGANPADAAGKQPASSDKSAPAAAGAKPHDTVPSTWRKEVHGEWANLSERVREEIHRREQDFHQGVKVYKEAAGFAQSMAQEFLPYQDHIRAKGLHPSTVVRDLLRTAHELETGTPEQKAATLLRIGKQYGIDSESLDNLRLREDAGQTNDSPQLSAVLQRVGQLEGTIASQLQDKTNAERADALAEIQRFAADPKHEFFEAVRAEVIALLKSGAATDLEDAYSRAIWVNSQVREQLLERQEQERKTREAEQAAGARRAAAASVRSRGTPAARNGSGAIEDTIRANARRVGLT